MAVPDCSRTALIYFVHVESVHIDWNLTVLHLAEYRACAHLPLYASERASVDLSEGQVVVAIALGVLRAVIPVGGARGTPRGLRGDAARRPAVRWLATFSLPGRAIGLPAHRRR